MTIETKFNYGDKVYLIVENKIQQGVIINVNANTMQQVVTPKFNGERQPLPPIKIDVIYLVKYNNNDNQCQRKEHQIFATKQELIDSL